MVYESKYRPAYSDELYHYGVPGMKWGHRKARSVSVETARLRSAKNTYKMSRNNAKAEYKAAKKAYRQTDEYKAKVKKRVKGVAIGAAIVGGTVLAAYGAKKVNSLIRDKNMQIAAERGRKETERLAKMMFGNTGERARTYKDAAGNVRSMAVNEDAIISRHLNNARNDTLGQAVKNVYNYSRSSRK